MKNTITGRIIAVDHARQSITIKPDNAQPLRVYAAEKIFQKLTNLVERNNLNGEDETRGIFTVSGRVLLSIKKSYTVLPAKKLFDLLNDVLSQEPSK